MFLSVYRYMMASTKILAFVKIKEKRVFLLCFSHLFVTLPIEQRKRENKHLKSNENKL